MTVAEPIWALGLMSGTSMDGVDAALIRTDGAYVHEFGPTLVRAYDDAERTAIRAGLTDAAAIADRTERPGAVAEAERIVTAAHVAATLDLIAIADRAGIVPAVVGFHGQTLLHAPDRGLTVQIGDAGRLAAATGLPVVHDFRAADVAAGGQGAPLVPIFHKALAERAGLRLPVAIVNVGGVANVTIIDEHGGLIAFDTGPGNAAIDDTMLAFAGVRFDDGGAVAARGRVDDRLVEIWMADHFFTLGAPKSLDRMSFRVDRLAGIEQLAFEDRVATLTAFTAASIAYALRNGDRPVRRVVVGGGGARNATLLRMIASRSGAQVTTADDEGFSADFLEAQAFAFLAVRRLNGLPISFPGTTGVPEPTVGGEIVGA